MQKHIPGNNACPLDFQSLQLNWCQCNGLHGCFAPTSIVNFFKGKQQKNMDFSFLQAINYIGLDSEQGATMIYNINCQYMVYFLDQIGHLLPPALSVKGTIGLFHVHAHKYTCFFRYATTFIPGAGDVAGEILESLWSNLNSISPSCWTTPLLTDPRSLTTTPVTRTIRRHLACGRCYVDAIPLR